MAAFGNIEIALQNGFADVYDSEMPVKYELAPSIIARIRDASMWMELINLPGASSVASLGDEGDDNNVGVYQVDLNVRLGKGKRLLLNKADEVASTYPAGKVLSYGGVAVTISRVSISPVRVDNGWAKISLSFAYYSRTKRYS